MHILSILLLRRTLIQYAFESSESFPLLLKTKTHFWLLTVSPRNRCHPHHLFQSLCMYLTGSLLSLLVQSSSLVSKRNSALPFLRLIFDLCSIITSWLTAAVPFSCPRVVLKPSPPAAHLHTCMFACVLSWMCPHLPEGDTLWIQILSDISQVVNAL